MIKSGFFEKDLNFSTASIPLMAVSIISKPNVERISK